MPSKHKLHSWLCCSSHHYSLRSEIVWRHQTWTITFSLQNTFENYLTKPLCKIFSGGLCVASVRDIATATHSPQTAAINTDPATARPDTFQRTHRSNNFLSYNTEIISYLGVWLFDSFSWLCASYCSSDSCCLCVMSDWRPAPADHDWLTYVAAQPESRPRHEEAAADHEDARAARTSGEANWGHGPRPTHSNTIFRFRWGVVHPKNN